MPSVGMRYLVAAQIQTEEFGQPIAYKPGRVMGRAISMDMTLTRSDAELYADDILAESDNSITGGTMTIGVAEVLEDAQVEFFGLKEDESSSETTYTETGTPAPYCGVGYVQERRYKGVVSHIAFWIYKAQFAPTAESARTKGKTLEWQTPTVTGEILGVNQDGDGVPEFRTRKVCATAKEAIDWLNKKAGITAAAA